jgi:hypothetical protein
MLSEVIQAVAIIRDERRHETDHLCGFDNVEQFGLWRRWS